MANGKGTNEKINKSFTHARQVTKVKQDIFLLFFLRQMMLGIILFAATGVVVVVVVNAGAAAVVVVVVNAGAAAVVVVVVLQTTFDPFDFLVNTSFSYPAKNCLFDKECFHLTNAKS